MKALVALILLVQLPVHKAVPAAAPAPLGCDDPESEAAAEVAVSYINAHSHHGYKFALNSIKNIRVLPQEPRKVGIQCTRPFRSSNCLKTLKTASDINKNENPRLFSTYYEKEDTKGLNNYIVFLELDLLETRCHILSPTPLANCTVRSFTDHAVEGDCDVKLQKVDGKFSVLASKCHSHPDSHEDVLQVCPDCPLLASLNNTEVSTLVTSALNDHNSKTPNAYLRLLEIGRAKIQYYPVHIVFAEFAVAATNCSAQEAKANAEACHLLPDDEANFGFCTATMVKEPSQDLEVDCQLYGHQPGVTYSQPGQDTSAGLAPSVVQGFTNHNLKFSHNNAVASESSSSEFPTAVLSAKPVAKRAVAEVAQYDKVPRPVGFVPPPPPCPGRIRYFKI